MSKERILAAAETLFGEKGFEGTSVRELAKAANVNLAMVSYYFGSKESLFEAIVEKRATQVRGILEEVKLQKDTTPKEKLDMIVDLYVDLLFANRQFNIMLYRELTLKQRESFSEHILDIFEKNWNEIRAVLEDGKDSQVFKKDIDVDMVIMTLFGHIHHCSHRGFLYRLEPQSEDAHKEPQVKKRIKNYLKSLFHDHLIE